MDRETMRLAILSATEEWREDDKKRARPAKNIPAGLRGRTFRLKPPEGGAAPEGGEEAGGEKKSHGNTRLPYGLCKRYGIDVPPGTTPREAWELLKGKGVNPQKEYRKLKERGERKARKESEEKEKREAEERARREAEEQAKREAEERAKREAEEKAKREAEEESPAAGGPEPERVKPKRFRSAREATAYLEDRCSCRTTASWEKGVCASAKKEIAGTVAALEERYGALDRKHNLGVRVDLRDGKGPDRRSVAAASCNAARAPVTMGLSFYGPYFGTEAALAYSRMMVRTAKGKDGGYFNMPSADGTEIAYLAAHEYGHCVEYSIMRERGVRGKGSFYDAAEQIKGEILQIAREIEPESSPGKLIKDGGSLSEYGSDNPREFFAECFANSVCGKPNVLGRAMAIYLDRCGIGRTGA